MILSHSKKVIFFRVTKTGSTTAECMLRLCGGFDMSKDVFCQTGEWELPALNLPATPGWEITEDFHEEQGPCRHGWAHATPAHLIKWGVLTLEQLREYDCYGFLRPVESRFVSGYLHSMRTGKWGTHGRFGFQPKQFMERWRSHQENFNAGNLLGRHQSEWFFVGDEQLVTPLDFRNYQAELRSVIDAVDGYQFPEIPRINRAHQHKVVAENRRDWAKACWDDFPEISAEVLEVYADDHQFYEDNFGAGISRLHQCA